jgi:hypothetical protein
MRRHCSRASIAGIPNFMHIALAIGKVLTVQVEQVLVRLETTRSALTPDEWYEYRQRLEHSLTTFRKVVEILYEEYVPALQKRFRAAAIREAIWPDLEPLTELCGAFLRVRDRVDACRKGALRVWARALIVPPIFGQDLLSDARWSTWSGAIRRYADRSTDWLKATG